MCNSYKKGGNEYKLLPYKVGPSQICQAIKEDEYFYKDFHSYTQNFPPLDTCDFKKGVYFVKNYLPDVRTLPPVIESNDYMVECLLYKGDDLIQGFKLFAQIYNIPSVPKL